METQGSHQTGFPRYNMKTPGWHPGFFRPCPVAIRRGSRVTTCKHQADILGFFGLAQSPSDEFSRQKRQCKDETDILLFALSTAAARRSLCVNARLTSWVFSALPRRYQTKFTCHNMSTLRLTSWVFPVLPSRHQTKLTRQIQYM